MSTSLLTRSEPKLPLPWEAAVNPVEEAIATAIGHLNARRPADAVQSLGGLTPSPAVGFAHANLLGRVLVVAEVYADALAWFDAALAVQRTAREPLLYRADVLAKLDRLPEAARAYEAALDTGAEEAATFHNYGTVLARLDRHADALVAYDAALKRQPVYPEGWRAAATTLRALGDTATALVFIDQALALQPTYRDAILDRANLLYSLDRLDEALATYDAALAHMPGEALLWNNRAIVLHDLGRMEEARSSAESAIRLDPLLAQGHLNLANVLFRLGAYQACVESCDRALALRENYAEAHCCRGLAQKMLSRFADALASFETALVHQPDFIYARANRGELKLLLGQFEKGWPDYEYRFFTERQNKPALTRPVPEWRGIHNPGDRIVVFADQGNGDAIQFARFLPRLVARRALVTFICPARLHRVLQSVTNGIQVRASVGERDDFDYQIALSSLPGAFRTNLATFDTAAPYLAADPLRVQSWAARLGDEGVKVGLCWRGNQNWQCDPQRSLPLDALKPLGRIPGLRLVSLQLPTNSEKLDGLPNLEDLGPDLDAGADAFLDTAAVMMNLDLVITCDTAVAHLAGALGRPVWLLLQSVPEWRWMLGRDTSPWYPSMRLFRQTRLGDWSGPVDAIAAELWGRLGGRWASAA